MGCIRVIEIEIEIEIEIKMHLSVLKLWNFRKYCEGSNGEPGLVVHFHEGVNVLIGENNSGVWLYAKRKDNVIIPSCSAGIDGQTDRMDSEVRELLKVVYFKPLRDALTNMTHGYKSRLAQILGAH